MAAAKAKTSEAAPWPTLFQYVGEDVRTYPDVPITVEPGEVVEWADGAPDVRWVEAPAGSVAKRKDNDPEPEVVEPEAEVPPVDTSSGNVEQNTQEG